MQWMEIAMVFGGLKGLRGDHSTNHTLVVIALIGGVFCLLGLVSGFVETSETSTPTVRPFLWNLNRYLYALGAVISLLVGLYCAQTYKERQTRFGVRFFLGLLFISSLGIVVSSLP